MSNSVIPVSWIYFQHVMPNSVMPDSVMLNSYLMLYQIPLYHFPLYLIPDCPLECYTRFLFSVIPDSIIPDSVIPDSCFDIPDSVIPNSIIPDSCFACYNRFRYTRFPAPVERAIKGHTHTRAHVGSVGHNILLERWKGNWLNWVRTFHKCHPQWGIGPNDRGRLR